MLATNSTIQKGSIAQFNAEAAESQQQESRPLSQQALIDQIQRIQDTSEKYHQAITDFAQQMAERCGNIEGPESLWDECEAFGLALADLRQYVDVGKPLGRSQIEDIPLLHEALKGAAWVVIRLFGSMSDGAPWTKDKYIQTWEDINLSLGHVDGEYRTSSPNALRLRMVDCRKFLKTIMLVSTI